MYADTPNWRKGYRTSVAEEHQSAMTECNQLPLIVKTLSSNREMNEKEFLVLPKEGEKAYIAV